MKTTYIFSIATICIFIASCKQNKPEIRHSSETPKALQEESTPSSFASKRTYNDLLNELYYELANKDPQLKKLEENITEISNTQDDSLALFTFFNSKNEKYYSTAKNLAASIHDSLLKKRIETLLTHSKNIYDATTGKHQTVLGSIKANDISIADLHVVLKIMKTLPIIEKYEAENLKSTLTLLQNYSQSQEKLIQKMDSAIKK